MSDLQHELDVINKKVKKCKKKLKRSELAQQLKQLKQERSLLKILVNELEDVERKKQQKFMNLEEIKDLALEDLANDTQLEMMLIPGGTFIMGSPKEEENSMDSERPQHEVTIEPFFMGKYQVTQAQWRFVAQLPQVNRELEQDPSHFKGDNRPVEQVSWYDAVEFCDRLSQYTGRTYRLPSEAEWEYACRAGTTTPFHFGETITTDLVNYNGNYTYGNGVKGVYRKETTEVGSFGVANNFGLYDMHGNVYEWCLDDWHENYTDAPADGSAWFSSDDKLSDKTGRTVLRGGSWYFDARFCRSAFRFRLSRDVRYDLYGFRVVCSAMCSKLK
jgi:formylglycine-generating enzyme required for sulfatase activity